MAKSDHCVVVIYCPGAALATTDPLHKQATEPQYSLFPYRMARPAPTQEACRAGKLPAVLSWKR